MFEKKKRLIFDVASCQENLTPLKIVAVAIVAFNTLLIGFQQFKAFGTKSERHTNSEANYAALYDQIKAQLQRNSRERQNAKDYLDWISDHFRNLKESSPTYAVTNRCYFWF